MQLPTLDSGGGDSYSGSGSAPQPGRLTPLGDILEDAITYVCSFLYLEEVGGLDIAMCSKKLRCAFLRSISGDALADLKTKRGVYLRPPLSGLVPPLAPELSKWFRQPQLLDREPLLTPELSKWLRRRGLALCGYNVNERLKGTFVGIFRNTKRLILPASIVNQSETLTSFLLESGHRLEEISVKDSDSARSLLPLLQTLHRLNPRVSAIEIDSIFDPPSPIDYSEVAQYIASHFTHLTKVRLPTTLNIIESSLADVETIWKACTNLQSFRCILDKDVDGGYSPAYMDFDDGHLALFNASSSLPTVHAAFQRFGGSLVSLYWTAEMTDIVDGDLVHLMSMCSQLQQFEIKCAMSVTDEGLIRALSPLPYLTSISLSGCDKLTVQGVIELIKRCRLLRHLKLWAIDYSRNDTLDEDGNLALSNINSDALAHEGSVESIDWGHTIVSDDDLHLITSMCSKLKHFELRRASKVTDEGLIRALSPLPHLTSISLSGCDKLTVQGVIELIKRCRLLRHLKLWYIDHSRNDTLEEDGGLALSNINSDALAHEGSVESIDWGHTIVSDDDLHLITSMCSKLKHFGLRDASKVTDEGLIRALSSLQHLTSISLNGCCKLTVTGLKTLIERCRPVRHFTLGKMYESRKSETIFPDCKNQFEFDEGVISGFGNLYWPLVEVFSRRWQRYSAAARGMH
jgi:hypothetical protein